MAYALTIDIVEPDDSIRMSVTFYGETEREVEAEWEGLKRRYEFFAEAEREGRTREELEEIDEEELPAAE